MEHMPYHEFVKTRSSFLNPQQLRMKNSDLEMSNEVRCGYYYGDDLWHIELLVNGRFYVPMMNDFEKYDTLEAAEMRAYIEFIMFELDEAEHERLKKHGKLKEAPNYLVQVEAAARSPIQGDTSIVISIKESIKEMELEMHRGLRLMIKNHLGFHTTPLEARARANEFMSQWATWEDFMQHMNDEAVESITLAQAVPARD